MTTPTRQRHRRTVRWIAAVLLTVIGVLGLAGPAAAHTDLTGSDPTDGSTLTAAPAVITLTFNEPVQNFEPVVALTGPDGQPSPTSTPIVDSTVVRSDVAGLGTAGTYTIAYRVVSIDGHPVTGQVRFQFAPAVDPTPTAPPAAGTTTAASSGSTGPAVAPSTAATGIAVTSTDGSGPPWWVWLIVGGAIIAVLITVQQRRRPQGRQ